MSLQVLIGIDNSLSMGAREQGGTRMSLTKELAASIIKTVCEIDQDGPEVWLFGQKVQSLGNVDVAGAQAALARADASEYGTATDQFLTLALASAAKHMANGDQALIVIFTDGAAQRPDLVKSQIIAFTQKMERDEQAAILFVSISEEAAAFLNMLDDKLVPAGAKFDIVDRKDIKVAAAMDVETLLWNAFED